MPFYVTSGSNEKKIMHIHMCVYIDENVPNSITNRAIFGSLNEMIFKRF